MPSNRTGESAATPPDRASFRYGAKYCEENIWWLIQDAALGAGDRSVALISSLGGAVPMAYQRAADPGRWAGWDYHVVGIVEQSDGRCWVWDLDTRLPFPCELELYLSASFPPPGVVDALYEPRIRLMSARDYVNSLVTDRSHMRDEGGGWLAPPPKWEPPGIARVVSGDATPNLMAWADMSVSSPGRVLRVADIGSGRSCHFGAE